MGKDTKLLPAVQEVIEAPSTLGLLIALLPQQIQSCSIPSEL